MAASSAFAKALVGQNKLAKALVWSGIYITTAGSAFASVDAVNTALLITAAVSEYESGKESSLKNKSEIEFQRKHAKLSTTTTHGEYFVNDWNYQEKITTDYDRETNTCKRCIISRKCKKTKWSLVRDRYCSSWEEWDYSPRCNELKF